LLFALPQLRRREPVRLLALFSLLLIGGLSLPARKVWNHELIAYPALALLAAAGVGPLLERLPARWQTRALAACAVLAIAFCASGLGARILDPPCVASREFAGELDNLAPGSPIPLVGPA